MSQLMSLEKAVKDGPSAWAHAIYVAKLEEVTGTWLWPGLDSAFNGHMRNEPPVRRSLSLNLSVILNK